MHPFSKILLMTLVLSLFIFGAPGSPMAAAPIKVFVSIAPQEYLVQQIGAEQVSVQALVAPGADPHVYEPKPGQMADLTKSRLYFSIGLAFERVWLPKIVAANPGLKVVADDRGITKLPMEGHAHGQALEEEMLDPHIWLAPPLLKIMAQTIQEALAETLPEQAVRFEENYRSFARRMDDLDGQIKALLADKQGTHFIAFHPSWGYFAKTYGLIQIPIEMEGKEPKPTQLRDIIHLARTMKIKVIFAQPQFSTRSAQMIAEQIGGQVLLADPLAFDIYENLLRQARAFQAAAR